VPIATTGPYKQLRSNLLTPCDANPAKWQVLLCILPAKVRKAMRVLLLQLPGEMRVELGG
jgi:hypothetical protein